MELETTILQPSLSVHNDGTVIPSTIWLSMADKIEASYIKQL